MIKQTIQKVGNVMTIPFTKMHGCGNDYIYINCFEHTIENPEQLSRDISNRHFGIGGDGIVLICPSDIADAKMRMFNIDGTEGKMCGNAIRCVAKYVYDNQIVHKESLEIDTLSGVKMIQLTTEDGKMTSATVNMGKAILDPKSIPLLIEGKEPLINVPIEIENDVYRITTISMGNPHCIIFCEDVESINLSKIGPKFEHHLMFPEGVNTEFIQVEDRNNLRMRVWERGSGETLACGTGACAAVVAAVLNGHCDKNTDVIVKLTGGELVIRYTGQSVFMTGPAVKVFEGVI